MQVAPIKVVRHLYTLIHGSPARDHNESIISELSKIGLTSGSLVDLLFEGYVYSARKIYNAYSNEENEWPTLTQNTVSEECLLFVLS